MRYVTEILNWVSGSFMRPDIVLLLAAMVFALIELGGFCSTWLTLLRHRRKREAIMELLRRDQRIEPGMLGQGVFARHLQELAAMNWDEIHCEKLIFDFSQNYEHELERAKFMMKIGPMLGLMGTLIPMGPADLPREMSPPWLTICRSRSGRRSSASSSRASGCFFTP